MTIGHRIKSSIRLDADLPSELEEETRKVRKRDRIAALERALEYLLDDVQFYEITQDRFKQDSECLFTIAIPDEMMPLIGKIEAGCKTLGEICDGDITEGDTKREEERHVIDAADYEELSEGEKSTYDRVLKGVNVKRYIVDWGELYIKGLSQTSEEPRLLIKDYSKKPTVAYEDEKFRCLRTVYCAYPKDSLLSQKYMLGLLNSTLLHFHYLAYFYTSRPGKGSFRFRTQFLKRLPIKYVNGTPQERIIEHVEEVISTKKELLNLMHKVAGFPDSYFKDAWAFETLMNKIKAQRLSKSYYKISESSLKPHYFRDIYNKEVFRISLATDEYVDFDSDEIASYVLEVLKNMSRITKRELLQLKIPKYSNLVDLMSIYRRDRGKIVENKKAVKELEKQIDDLVYKLYDIDFKERRDIEEYLARFR